MKGLDRSRAAIAAVYKRQDAMFRDFEKEGLALSSIPGITRTELIAWAYAALHKVESYFALKDMSLMSSNYKGRDSKHVVLKRNMEKQAELNISDSSGESIFDLYQSLFQFGYQVRYDATYRIAEQDLFQARREFKKLVSRLDQEINKLKGEQTL